MSALRKESSGVALRIEYGNPPGSETLFPVEYFDLPEDSTRRVLVTPDMARELLDRNTRNRKLKWANIRRYAKSMREGRWVPNGSTIAWGRDGVLNDGQNRFYAVIEADTPVLFLFAFGYAPEAFRTIDDGAVRTVADVHGIDGVANPKQVAAATTLAINFIGGHGLREKVTKEEHHDFIVAHPYAVEIASRVRGHAGPLTDAPLAAVLLLANESRRFDDFVEEFLHGVSTGLSDDTHGLNKTDPRRWLREWAFRQRKTGPQGTNFTLSEGWVRGIAAAWTSYLRGQTRGQYPNTTDKEGKKTAILIHGYDPARWS
jgi:hypothetical protein